MPSTSSTAHSRTPANDTPLHAVRRARLDSLERRFDEHRRRFPSEWCDYGEADPVRDATALLNPCATCGERPQLVGNGQTWTPTCGCGATALPARMRWQAVLHWNRNPASTDPDWRAFPFFGLDALEPAEARTKLLALREHLELRSHLEGARRVCGLRVGSTYLQRLKAYHGWCCYAQEVWKRQVGIGATPRTQ